MRTLRSGLMKVALPAIILVTACSALAQATDEKILKYPMAISCERDGALRFGYLSEIRTDGSAAYHSVDGRRAAQLNTKGVLEPLTPMKPTGCIGKSLEELRDEGRTVEFPR